MKLVCISKSWIVLSILVLLISLVVTHVIAAGTMEIDRYVIGSGGTTSGSDPYTLNGTIGQPVAGPSSGAGLELCFGFWCKTSEVKITFLPVILRQ